MNIKNSSNNKSPVSSVSSVSSVGCCCLPESFFKGVGGPDKSPIASTPSTHDAGTTVSTGRVTSKVIE